MAVGVLPFVGGLLLNFAVLAGWISVINYHDWEKVTKHNYKNSAWLEFKKSLNYKRPSLKKKWIYLAIASLILNCLAYKSCLCFYND